MALNDKNKAKEFEFKKLSSKLNLYCILASITPLRFSYAIMRCAGFQNLTNLQLVLRKAGAQMSWHYAASEFIC